MLEHSTINLNRKFLNDIESWDEHNILKRGAELFEVALKIWPGPDEQFQETFKNVSGLSINEMEQDSLKKDDEIVNDQYLQEKNFLKDISQNLGESDTSALRSFYDVIKSSPYEICWDKKENETYLIMKYPKLCSGSIIKVRSNGNMEFNFYNIRGSENAELFKEILIHELTNKMDIDIPDDFLDKTFIYPINLWINKNDILLDILDNLLAEYIEISN
jgi:hypothetical protein